jgi:isoleucyl-tRNA synthetase
MNDRQLQQRLTPYLDLISEELNVHATELTPSEEAHVRYVVKPNFRRLGPRLGQKMKSAKKAFEQADAAAMRAELLEKGAASIEIEGESIALDPEDVEVLVEAAEGYAAAGDRTTVVALDTEIDQKLLDEGLYREILRRVQDLRKDLDVEYTERVAVCICGSERVQKVLEETRENLAAEALIDDLRVGGPCLESCEVREVELDGETVRIELARPRD